jgi:hypothetical protein
LQSHRAQHHADLLNTAAQQLLQRLLILVGKLNA